VLLAGGSLAYGLIIGAVGYWPREWFWWAMPIAGVTAAVMFMPTLLMTTEATPERIRTTSLGAFNAAGSLGFIVGPLVGGAVSTFVAAEHGARAGYRAAFLVAGASQALLSLVAFAPLWRFERRASGRA
jgi:MFS family permease